MFLGFMSALAGLLKGGTYNKRSDVGGRLDAGLDTRLPLRHERAAAREFKLPAAVGAQAVVAKTKQAAKAEQAAKLLAQYSKESLRVAKAEVDMLQTDATHQMQAMQLNARIADIKGNYAIASMGHQLQLNQTEAQVSGVEAAYSQGRALFGG